jgi:Type II CAAX prenyl endopeptidase Rce1-like
MTDAISTRLRLLNPAVFVLVMAALAYLVMVPLWIAEQLYPPLHSDAGPSSYLPLGWAGRLIVACVIGPLLETGLNQSLPTFIFRDWLKLGWTPTIAISAAIFGACHPYSLSYVILGVLVGGVLAYCYGLKHAPGHSAFFQTSAVHALRNVAGVLLQ